MSNTSDDRLYIKKEYRSPYAKLYRNTYWFQAEYSSDRSDEYKLMYRNRDELAQVYRLKASAKYVSLKYHFDIKVMEDAIYLQTRGQYIPDGCEISYREMHRDHSELYRTVDGDIVSIYSTYDMRDEITQLSLRNGYILTKPVYNLRTNTFIKVIDKKYR